MLAEQLEGKLTISTTSGANVAVEFPL